ncbi:MAG: hypothetical protein WC864_10275 [Ilumatobacteraceae bacterium]
MGQVSWRADDKLVARVKRVAGTHRMSMNEYLTHVLDVATDPSRASSAEQQLRERLMSAGLLVIPKPLGRSRPTRAEVKAAGERAIQGTPMSDLVSEGR